MAVVASLTMLAVQPAPAAADTFSNNFFPNHWGPYPHINVPSTHPFYRAIVVIDNTGDPSLSQHIQTFSQIVNYLHVAYNPNYPVMLYYKDIVLAPGNPCQLGASGWLVLCKDETLGGVASPGAPGIAAIFPTPAPTNHILYGVTRFRPSVVDPWCAGDKFTVVVQLMSNSMGLDQNLTNPASAMFPTLPIGRCSFNGWTGAELDRMNLQYNHPVG